MFLWYQISKKKKSQKSATHLEFIDETNYFKEAITYVLFIHLPIYQTLVNALNNSKLSEVTSSKETAFLMQTEHAGR